MHDIEPCRTESLGGQLYDCEQCQQPHYSSHSGKHRHCHTCHNASAEPWLKHQERLLLPVTHCIVTFTLPDALRAIARPHHKTIDNLLCRTSAEALQEPAWDPRCIGARIGMVGVLHTWTRDRHSHPHVHSIVAGGGLATDDTWRPARQDFLVPVKPLSVLFRATFRDALQKTPLCPRVPEPVGHQAWVVHCEPVGRGQEAFRYLAPSIFRVAISHNRILALAEGSVTFQYQVSATAQGKICTVSAQEFIRRFLQHVLPDRFINVRYDGLLSPGNRQLLTRARQLLGAPASQPTPKTQERAVTAPTAGPRCPHCGSSFILLHSLRPQGHGYLEHHGTGLLYSSAGADAQSPVRRHGLAAPCRKKTPVAEARADAPAAHEWSKSRLISRMIVECRLV